MINRNRGQIKSFFKTIKLVCIEKEYIKRKFQFLKAYKGALAFEWMLLLGSSNGCIVLSCWQCSPFDLFFSEN